MALRLSLEDRVEIEVGWVRGLTIGEIAELLGRDFSVLYRELARNNSARHGPKSPLGPTRGGVYRWGYAARWAQRQVEQRARRPRPRKLLAAGPLRDAVVAALRERHSPQQIQARLRRDHPDDPSMHVSHETIYRAVFVQARGSLREELHEQVALRSGRPRRRRATTSAAHLRSRRPWVADWRISDRPAEADDRAVPGHWEGDLVLGARGASAIITLVERSTRYVMLGRLPDGRRSDQVVPVLIELMSRVPSHLRRSLTWDQGSELADNQPFRLATDCPLYFADPHSPWQRGSNENTNGLLRQYFPKGTSLAPFTQDDLDTVAAQLNGRPRMTLEWDTPAEALEKLLAPTG